MNKDSLSFFERFQIQPRNSLVSALILWKMVFGRADGKGGQIGADTLISLDNALDPDFYSVFHEPQPYRGGIGKKAPHGYKRITIR
ncbi:MAG: hypothetical protein WCS94_14620 [Verrucomicrobiota bacterium]